MLEAVQAGGAPEHAAEAFRALCIHGRRRLASAAYLSELVGPCTALAGSAALASGVRLTLQEALVGFARRLTLPDDSTLRVAVAGVTAHQGVKVVAGGGMPRRDSEGGRATRGDLHLHTRVLFPKELSAQQRAFFEDLDS